MEFKTNTESFGIIDFMGIQFAEDENILVNAIELQRLLTSKELSNANLKATNDKLKKQLDEQIAVTEALKLALSVARSSYRYLDLKA